MSGFGREALPVFRKWSEDPLECLGVIGMPSRKFDSCRVSLPDVWELSGDPPGCP